MIYEALAYAVTHIGLSPESFARLTVDEWQAIGRGQQQKEEADTKERWEATRCLIVATLSPWLKTGATANEILPLPWDDTPPEPTMLTEAEKAELLRRYTD